MKQEKISAQNNFLNSNSLNMGRVELHIYWKWDPAYSTSYIKGFKDEFDLYLAAYKSWKVETGNMDERKIKFRPNTLCLKLYDFF